MSAPHDYPLLVLDPQRKAARPWAGIAACCSLAVIAGSVSDTAHDAEVALGTLTVALLLGVVLGNAMPARADTWAVGVAFSKKHVLRLGVILFGFRLTVHDFQAGGFPILLIDALVLTSTFALAMFAGMRILKLDPVTSALIGAGASICGASAVLATAPIVGAGAAQASVAMATVAVFGTAALLLYPALYRLNAELGWLPGGASGYGVYIGSTVHEVAQVVAIANASATATQDPAVVTKMGRVALLAPFLLSLALWKRKGCTEASGKTSLASAIPWFPALFAVAVLVNSFAPIGEARHAIEAFDTLVLATAMAALGIATRLSAIRAAGAKPLVLAGVLFGWLVVAGGFINLGVTKLVGSL